MTRRADLVRRPEDPRGLLLAEHPNQNTRPRPTGPLGTPGEVWETCRPSTGGFDQAEHFLCRGERREFERGGDDGDADGVEEVGWLVCGCWCHYLLALDRMPPRRRCGCGAEPLIYLGVLWPGIDEWPRSTSAGRA